MFMLVSIVIVYLGVIAFLGYQGYRKTKNAADFLVGGRDVHPYVMAMSYGATFISTSAIVGFGGVASLFGMSLIWLPVLNISIGIFIAFVFFGKRTRRMGLNLDAHTFPEFLGRRVGSHFVQRFAGIVIFVFMPLYAAAVLIGASKILEHFLGIDYRIAVALFSIMVAAYVIMGGLKGVMYTDALQGSLMFFGMLFLLFTVYAKLGGVVPAHTALSDLSNLIPENLKAGGLSNWAGSPAGGSPNWWVIFSSIVLGVGIGVLAQPQLIVRFMTVKSDKEMNRAVGIGGLFILATTGTAFLVGALSNVMFFNETGQIAVAAGGGNPDNVIPLFITSFMPSWFVYLFMLVILSAGMSTLSSQFHAIGTSIGRDVITLGKAKDENLKKKEVVVTKVGILVSILLTVLLSMVMTGGVIARATAIFFGLMASSFLAPYFASLYWKKLTRKGAIAGIVSGFTASILAFLFFHTKEAAVFKLSELLFGRTTLIGGIFGVVDPIVYALPISIIFTIVVSLLTKVEDQALVEHSFRNVSAKTQEAEAPKEPVTV